MQMRQQNRVSMGLAVLQVFVKHTAVWTGNVRLSADRALLETQLTAIQTLAGIQGTATSGVADGKNRKQLAMIEAVLPIADDLHALADDTGDAVLAAKTDVVYGTLVNLADTAIGPRCQEILDLAGEHAAALLESDTTATDLAAAQAAVDAYLPMATATRNAIVDRSGHTQGIEDGIRALEAFLRNRLDKRMSKYAQKAPEFYTDYRNARKIIDLGGRHDPAPPPAPPV